MRIPLLATVALAVLGALVASPTGARAGAIEYVYDWSLSGGGFTGSGTFETQTVWTASGVPIIAATGRINNGPDLLLYSASSPLYNSDPYILNAGINFANSVNNPTTFYELYSNGPQQDMLSCVLGCGSSPVTQHVSLSVTFGSTVVSEPAPSLLLASGIAVLGLMRRRRQTVRQTPATTA